jgi:ABC-2 type transport system permease protein
MKTMKWLIEREYWEHKGMLVWAPLAVGAVMVIFTLVMLLAGQKFEFELNGHVTTNQTAIHIAPDESAQIAQLAATAYPMVAVPVYVMLGFLVFFYCLGALHDERRDRSILFWKSLPVSDAQTVLSKAAMALIGVPLVITVVGCLTSLLIMVLAGIALAMHGANLFGALLMSAQFWLTPLRLLSLVPVYMLWALPAVGWLLLVSSWARGRPFLWAVTAPLLTGAVLMWAEKVFHLPVYSKWVWDNVIMRLLLSVLPGQWIIFSNDAQNAMAHQDGHQHPVRVVMEFFNQAWMSLGSPTMWAGAIAGVAMIIAAVWIRRWSEEG